MFLIMGIQEKEAVKEYVQTLPCHNCSGERGFSVITHYRYFHLFFLPVWKWHFRHAVKCAACGTHYTVKPESEDKYGGDFSKLTYWDIEPVNKRQFNTALNLCSKCGNPMQEDFDYCPKCGNRVK